MAASPMSSASVKLSAPDVARGRASAESCGPAPARRANGALRSELERLSFCCAVGIVLQASR
eukprot:4827353-Prymnesium_polylepis.3